MSERIQLLLEPGEYIEPIPEREHGSQEWAYGNVFSAVENNTLKEGNSVVIDIEQEGATEPVIITSDITLSVKTMQGKGLAVIYNTEKKGYVRLVEMHPGQEPLRLERGDAYYYLNTGEENLTLRDDSIPAFQDGDELFIYPKLDKQQKPINQNDQEQREVPEGWKQELPTIFLRAYQLARAHGSESRETFFKSRGAGMIFHIKPTDEFMFFLRDDKPSISCPNMIDIIGGHMEKGETPEETARREVREELINDDTGEPLEVGEIKLFMTFIDDRPGEHNIFGCELDYVPNIHTEEGQGLVRLSREQALSTEFAYNYRELVRQYVHETEKQATVRQARLEDIDALHSVFETWIRDPDSGEILTEEIADLEQEIRSSIIAENGNRKYFIAQGSDGKVRGIMGMQSPPRPEIMCFARTDNPMETINAYVSLDKRLGGAGKALAKHIESLATEQGYSELLVNSGPRYIDTGWPFWTKLYGKPVGVAVGLYGSGRDAMVWRKPLSIEK